MYMKINSWLYKNQSSRECMAEIEYDKIDPEEVIRRLRRLLEYFEKRLNLNNEKKLSSALIS